MLTFRSLLFPAVAAAYVAIAPQAHAASSDPDVLRIEQAGHGVRWNAAVAGKEGKFGHAEALINAPLDKVRAQVTDFGHYKDFAPQKFNNARVVAKENGTTDLYMQVPIMHGMVKLWFVLRFGAPKMVNGVETLEGTFVRGNVETANIVFQMKQVADDFSVLKCDLLIKPSVPAPQGLVDEELRDAAYDAVTAVHERAQGRPGQFYVNPKS